MPCIYTGYCAEGHSPTIYNDLCITPCQLSLQQAHNYRPSKIQINKSTAYESYLTYMYLIHLYPGTEFLIMGLNNILPAFTKSDLEK